jgi:hypothetical protein
MNELQVGDSVVVKPDVQDPGLNINIEGWQGRISEINKEDNLICIDWDSVTLEQMPSETIDQCEEEGLDWSKWYLYTEEVELTTARDSELDVERVIEALKSKHAWSYLGEEGKRIQTVLDRAESNDDWAAFEAWQEYLEEALKFPFEAKVSEWQERGPLETGDRVKVWGIVDNDDLYGIIVSLSHGRRKYAFPLCDLDAVDESSSNYQPIRDYAVWFANH